MSVDPSTGIISWVEPKPGTYNVNVSAYDGTVTIYHEFILTVEGAPEDDLPCDHLLFTVIILFLLVLLTLLFILIRRKGKVPGEE